MLIVTTVYDDISGSVRETPVSRHRGKERRIGSDL